jgi:hypothetical protein
MMIRANRLHGSGRGRGNKPQISQITQMMKG